MIKLTFVAVALTAVGVNAICPGFNYGIADLGNQNYRFYDDSCKAVETYIATGVNVCTSGKFTCSSSPVTITGAKILNNWYACRSDSQSGSCNGEKISVCCRNDGN
ncbi:hypothetical protein HETIRDRAFT_115608 [Heterobasidion irregulare TC 32-1]|uniref:Uncharacterized protein n=1 Tax=Heterobasidion irregulare (strain TC 32-1) TaxID=747525 RepID=W4K9Y1_HETIT|nr:uncharacterized protein HETIRDRAFT_115608 [Heterobasidion irregulare TC 32-1]ETW82155.1 hypothetical protein HETIRDRAFT_115608 [Heterobasidion irregulare TC 32-1]